MFVQPADDNHGRQDQMQISLLLDARQATIAGVAWIDTAADAGGRPLVIGLHGGGFGRGYFTGLHPLPEVAAARGADTVLLDRPGAGDSRFLVRDGDILADNAAALSEAIADVWDRHGKGRPGIFLIGHSIGGAIALLIAARGPAWPLIGVAVSGIGQQPPATMPVFTGGDGAAPTQPPLPRAALASIMMAPGAATDTALDALEAASLPAVTEELVAIYSAWPTAVEPTLMSIGCPVQIIVAEHDPLWVVDTAAVDRLRSLASGRRDVVVVWRGAGHCIDYHDGAPSFHDAIFSFMKDCMADG